MPSSSYLVLHRATLTVPVMSPSPRWALTPPFHPCLIRCDLIGIHVALAIGGLFSVVPVSDRSAWALPSALPPKSGLSSRAVTSDHPVVFPARPQYRKRPGAMQQSVTASHGETNLSGNRRQFSGRKGLFLLVNRHRLGHPFFELLDPCLMPRVRRQEL